MKSSQPLRLDGKRVAEQVLQRVAQEVEQIQKKGRTPGLAVVLVGDDPASHVYVRNKQATCMRCGIHTQLYHLPEQATHAQVQELVEELNQTPIIDGILVQKPLPPHIDSVAITEAIVPYKDVDGFHPFNQGQLWNGGAGFVPCTPAGVIALLRHYEIPLAGKHAVVLGRSNIVGKPMAALLLREQATVTICHSQTPDVASVCRQADVLVAAIGKPNWVRADWVAPGAVVIDVGINRDAHNKLCGDVAYEEVAPLVHAITPVPGGIGPMTIALLMSNTVQASRIIQGMDER